MTWKFLNKSLCLMEDKNEILAACILLETNNSQAENMTHFERTLLKERYTPNIVMEYSM